MKINEGFKIDRPDAFVPWDTSETELVALLEENGLRQVAEGYYTLTCESLGGLQHELGFHFAPLPDGRLSELEFFRKSYADQAASYQEFQDYFERAFGKPTHTTPGEEGFPYHEWRVRGATIVHFVFDRFGPEEHMRIRRA